MQEEFKKLLALDDKIETLKAELKALNDEYDSMSWRLAVEMEQSNIDSMKVDGINFIKSQRVFAKVEDTVAFHDWVRANDMWPVTHMISAQKINSYVKELVAASQELPPGVNPGHVKHFVQIRRS